MTHFPFISVFDGKNVDISKIISFYFFILAHGKKSFTSETVNEGAMCKITIPLHLTWHLRRIDFTYEVQHPLYTPLNFLDTFLVCLFMYHFLIFMSTFMIFISFLGCCWELLCHLFVVL